MLSDNEYTQLKKVIVGRADKAKIPAFDKSMRCVNYADLAEDHIPNPGVFPKQALEEANEDLETLCDFLRKEKIQVLRPAIDYDPLYYTYCPRDTLTVHRDKILAAPMPLISRKDEHEAYAECFKNYKGAKYIHKSISRSEELYNENCVMNKNILALNETDPCFDAANILRHHDDIFYLISNSGNKKGGEFLKQIFPNETIHYVENVYSFMHIDSTLSILRDGLLLCNPSRVRNKEQLPKFFHKWDIIYAPEPYDIGHYPGYCLASPWINVNLLSINENLVIVEERQIELQKLLKTYKIECAMLPMRHARTLGGCFHCVTLDLERAYV